MDSQNGRCRELEVVVSGGSTARNGVKGLWYVYASAIALSLPCTELVNVGQG